MSFLFKRLPSLTFCISTKHMAKQLNNADMDTMQSDLLNHVESIDVRGSHSHSLSTQGSSGGAASNSPPAAGADSDGLLPLPLRRSLTLPLSSSDYFTTDLHVEAPGGSSSQVGELDCKSSIGEGLDGQSGTNSSVPTTPGGESQHTLDWTASPCSQASKNSIASSFTFDDEHNSDVRNADARSCDGTDVHLTLCGGSTHLSDGGAKAEVDCVLSSTVDALLLADHFWVSSHNPSTSCDRVGHQQTIARDRWFVPEAMVESTGLWTTDEYASVAGYTYRGSGSGSASGLYPTDTSTSCSDEARRLCRPEHVRTAVPPVQIQKCDSEATGPLQQHTRSASLGIVGKTTGEEVCGSTSRVARQLLRLSATELEAAVDEQVRLMEDVMNEEAVGPLEDLSTLLHSSLMLTPATSPPSSPKSTTSSSSSSSSSSSDDSEDSDNDSDNGSIASGASLHSDESDSEDEATEEGAQHEDESCGTDDDDDEEEEDSNKPPPLVVSESEAVALALPKAPIASSAEQEKSTSPTAAPPDPDNSTTDIDAPTSLVADTETTSTAVTKRQSDEALANATCTHIRALAKELRKLPKQVCVSRTEGSMFVRFDPDAPYLLRCCLTGVRGTPYSYGVFVFDIKCPPDYPTSPPKVLHVTKGSQSIQAPHSPGGFSPNMHWDSGKVCLSLLGTWDGPGWLADKSNLYQVMSTILLMILAAPNPYVMEPGHGGWEGEAYIEDGAEDAVPESESSIAEAEMYKYQVCAATARHAILETLRSPPMGFEKVVLAHLCVSQREILTQVRKWANDASAAGHKDSASSLLECVEEIETEFMKRSSDGLRLVLMENERRGLVEFKTLLQREQQRVLDGLANMWRWDPEQGVAAKDRLCKIQSAIDQTDTQLRAMAESPVQANPVATTTPMATASTNTCTNCHNATAAA